MHLERFLTERWRALSQEFAKFGTIGVINLLVNFAVFNLLVLTVMQDAQLKAKAVAAAVSITSAYFMNRHWTYRDRPKSTLRREYALFFLFNLVGLMIEVAVVGIAKYGFGQTHVLVLNLCTGIGIGLGTMFRFWAYRTHVFRLEPAPAAVVVAASATSFAPARTLVTTAVPISVHPTPLGNPAWSLAARLGPTAEASAVASGGPVAGGRQNDDSVLDGTSLEHEIELDGLVALAEQPARATS